MHYIKLLIMTIFIIVLNGCGGSSDSSNSPEPEETLRVACVGDSITAGSGLDNPTEESYPSQLNTILGEGFQVGNFGVSGATVLKKGNKPYWDTNQFEPSHTFNPDIVVIMLGTNDAKPSNWVHEGEFISDYSALINTYKSLDSRPIIYICYPTPVYGEVAGITDERITGEVIPKIKQVSIDNSVATIDNYSALSDKESLFPDKIHPNVEGARLIAETVYQVIY